MRTKLALAAVCFILAALVVLAAGCAVYDGITGQTTLRIREAEAKAEYQKAVQEAYATEQVRIQAEAENQRVRDYYAYLAAMGKANADPQIKQQGGGNMFSDGGLNLLAGVSIGWQWGIVLVVLAALAVFWLSRSGHDG